MFTIFTKYLNLGCVSSSFFIPISSLLLTLFWQKFRTFFKLFFLQLILHSHKHFHFCNSIHANILSLLNDTPTYAFNHLFKSTWSTDKRQRRNYLYLGYDVFPYTRDIKPRCLPLIFIAYDFCLFWHHNNFIWENLIGKI